MNTWVIALDGHAGAGKSTVAQAIAHRLGFLHINTGALYRAITWKVLQEHIDPHDRPMVAALANQVKILLPEQPGGTHGVILNGHSVTHVIRTPEVTQQVSVISAYPEVREAVNCLLRRLDHSKGIVMDGRDIGTIVFPQAQLKIFLTASLQERIRRQYQESQDKGDRISLQELEHLTVQRDKIDSERPVAPLQLAQDAILLDTTQLTPEEVIEQILSLWKKLNHLS